MNRLTAITMALLLASCSDESNETLTLPEDMHTNEREIAATAEFVDVGISLIYIY